MQEQRSGHPPILEGNLSGQIPSALLVEIEHLRTSGELHFQTPTHKGAITLIAGMIAEEQQALASGEDPLDILLAAKEGSYALYQMLRPLPVSNGDDQRRTGSLAVHVPAELMNYCEASGVTGTLTVEREGKSASIGYQAGELDIIRVDGSEEQDLHNVFGWTEGTFTIALDAPTKPEAKTDDSTPAGKPASTPAGPPFGTAGGREPTGVGFLSVVEVALDSILAEREKHRRPSQSHASMPEPPKVRSAVSGEFDSVEDPSDKREPTVRVVYLGDGDEKPAEPADVSTRHVGGRLSDPEEQRYVIDPLVEASEVRRPSGELDQTPSVGKRIASALGWTVVLLALMFVALIVLANLPQL